MKADLDALMQRYGLDALFVYGDETPNMQRRYLMNGAHATGYVVKAHGAVPIAIVGGMEIDEAAKSGLRVMTFQDFGAGALLVQYKNDPAAFRRALIAAIFEQLGLRGRVGFYGAADVSALTWLVHEVLPTLPNVQVAYDYKATQLFEDAYETKDPDEIAHLAEAGRLASAVVRATWDFIGQHRAAADGTVVAANGQPLTIGAVKRFILLQNLERGLENADGLIFAQGRDAGVPHSSGDNMQVLRTGQSIVFDFFPRLAESGYFHDMTRTWSLGYAAPDVQAAYYHVLEAFQVVTDSLKVGHDGSLYQNRVCDLFEAHGHKTTRTNPGTLEGYVHSLGHGIGLNIHEAPHLGNYSRGGALTRGSVFTIEPGLYYPEKGYGIRIEDSVYFDQNGTLHTLTDFPYDLVLPLQE